MSGARSFLARNTANVDCIMFELLLLLSAFMRAMYFRCFQSTTDRLCLCFAQHPSEENLVKPAVVAARNHIKDTGSGSTGCSSPCYSSCRLRNELWTHLGARLSDLFDSSFCFQAIWPDMTRYQAGHRHFWCYVCREDMSGAQDIRVARVWPKLWKEFDVLCVYVARATPAFLATTCMSCGVVSFVKPIFFRRTILGAMWFQLFAAQAQ